MKFEEGEEFCYECGRRFQPSWYSLTVEGVSFSLKTDGGVKVSVKCPDHNYGSKATMGAEDFVHLGQIAVAAELFLARHAPIGELRAAVRAAKGE